MTTEITSLPEVQVSRPTLAFVFALIGGVAMISFSTGIAGYTQYYFIENTQVQNSFLIGIFTIFTGALLYQRRTEHVTWSLVLMSMAIGELILVESITSAIPFIQLSSPTLVVGPMSGIMTFLSGILGLRFRV